MTNSAATVAPVRKVTCEVRNLTPNRISLIVDNAPEKEYVLAPLATRTLLFDNPETELTVRKQLRGLHERQIIRITDEIEASDDSIYFQAAAWAAAIGLFIGGLMLPDFFPKFSDTMLLGLVGKKWLLFGSPILLLAIWSIVYLMAKGKLTPWLRRIAMSLRQLFTLLFVLCIAVALPLAMMALYSPHGLTVDGWAAGMQQLSAGGATGLGRSIVFAFVCVAAALPGLLYFLFDRKRVAQLRENFEQQIFRLDRRMTTLADVEVRYGSRLYEIWGNASPHAAGRLFSGSQWPVVLCTIVISGGWTVIVLFAAIQSEFNGATDLGALLKPLNSTYAFGFLGVYYFALGMIARRYTRGDLQPKAYSMITARVLVVLVSASVASAVMGEVPTTWALLFFVGVLPETFLVFLRETIGARLRKRVLIANDRLPLTRLEGIDLYDRARLEEEGIANLDNLAHSDLVDLMLNTSIPTMQLVEWVDQALLYLRVHNNPGDAGEQIDDKLWHELRAFGVRRASDLIDERAALREEIVMLIQTRGKDSSFEARLRLLVTLLSTDEWFENIRHWRAGETQETRKAKVWRIDSGGLATSK